jgi:hypothetical protein
MDIMYNNSRPNVIFHDSGSEHTSANARVRRGAARSHSQIRPSDGVAGTATWGAATTPPCQTLPTKVPQVVPTLVEK